MHITVDIEVDQTQKQTPEEVSKEVSQAFYMKKYMDGKVSLGKFAELMGMSYEEARDWLNAQGVQAPSKLPPELKAYVRESGQEILKELGIS